jgi:hypothetical protein
MIFADLPNGVGHFHRYRVNTIVGWPL